MKTDLHRALDSVGLTAALLQIAADLADAHDSATERWIKWLDIPAFQRRGMDATTRDLEDRCRAASDELHRFVANPLAVVPITVGVVTVSQFAALSGADVLQIAARSGSHVVVLTLEVAHA